MEKKQALANYLGVDVEEIEDGYDNDHFEINGEEYLVCDDYDDAYDRAVEGVQDLLDTDGFTFVNGWENYVDSDWFEDTFREMEENYVYDIEDESDSTYENRLIAELVDNGILDEDEDFHYDEDDEDQLSPLLNEDIDLDEKKEEYVEYILNNISDFVEEYRFEFGDDDFNKVCQDYNLVDIRKLAEYCIDMGGPGSELAYYDGNEIELEDGYLAYRQN